MFGNLAFAHPFLDGNGRTLMVVHAVLANRGGISFDWSATDKTAFLDVTKRIKYPGKGHPRHLSGALIQKTDPGGNLAAEILKALGFDVGKRAPMQCSTRMTSLLSKISIANEVSSAARAGPVPAALIARTSAPS
ncbi:hypothetical protein ACVWXP_007285 [Bradyrhizobium sp. USDA 4463]